MFLRWLCYVSIFSGFKIALAYKPVVLLHGVLSDNTSMELMSQRIQKLHPGTKVYIPNKFTGWSSLSPMWRQVLEVGADLMEIMAFHPEGVNLVGYSQGGLLARGILEQFSDHNVHTFISLSSPQCGQYGTKFLHLFFPTLACEEAYELFYSVVGQHTSIGNYWNDPHHKELYLKYSAYLAYINNDVSSERSERFRAGVLRLSRMILIGGPDDEVITPWQSSHFACFDETEKVVEMKEQPFYRNDSFGLKTLDTAGKLSVLQLSGNMHYDWHSNQTIIDDYIVPFLD